MTRTRIRAWLLYAASGAVATLLVATIAAALVGERRAVWVAAAIAYVIQLMAFGLLVTLNAQPQGFMLAWVAGMIFRFGALGVCAAWLSRTEVLPQSTTLLSLVGFLFLLLLIEPLFLSHGRHDQRV
jgi:hypothetical protein